jgi:hypothetical protein
MGFVRTIKQFVQRQNVTMAENIKLQFEDTSREAKEIKSDLTRVETKLEKIETT